MSNNLREYASMNSIERMMVTAFCGGKFGDAVQITIDGVYCGLAENQVKDLILTLQARIDHHPSYLATGPDIDVMVMPKEAE